MAGLAQQLPLREKSLDGIFCECVLSLLDDPGLALFEFARILKPEGWLVITDLYARRPEGVSTLQHLPLNSCLKGARSKQEIVRVVENTGFGLFLWEDHSDLLKQMAASAVFEFGSMREFWKFFAPHCAVSDLECCLGQVRPGYYLLAARKKGRSG
jgi:SAM-dependent methyltransferase